MVRNARKKPVQTAKMYQHFAMATIAITAMVGILADGEAQQAVSEYQAEKAKEERIANAEALSRGNRRQITGDEDPGTGSFGSSVSMGITTTGYSSSRVVAVTKPGPNLSVIGKIPVWERVGLSEEQWKQLTDEQKDSYARQRDPLYGKSEREQIADYKRMSEASRLRSGGGANNQGADAPDAPN